MEELRLPGTAQELWQRSRRVINETFRSEDGTKQDYVIGGGTILAARWGHRQSTDIDLWTSDARGVLEKTDDQKERLAEAIGMKLVRGGETRHISLVPHGTEEAYGRRREEGGQPGAAARAWEKLDISWTKDMLRELPNEAARCMVDGHEERVLSTAQILTGKLKRARKSPVRDVYDIITAGRQDPESLDKACRAIGIATVLKAGNRWMQRNSDLAAEAEKRLKQANGDPITGQERIGYEARRTVIEAISRIEGRPPRPKWQRKQERQETGGERDHKGNGEGGEKQGGRIAEKDDRGHKRTK